jgi:hypothetical protein
MANSRHISRVAPVDKWLLMFYVCQIATDQWMEFLAGPYATEAEAIAASGAFEVEHPEYRMRTFVWTCRDGREYFSRRVEGSVANASNSAESAFPAPVALASQHQAAASPFSAAGS